MNCNRLHIQAPLAPSSNLCVPSNCCTFQRGQHLAERGHVGAAHRDVLTLALAHPVAFRAATGSEAPSKTDVAGTDDDRASRSKCQNVDMFCSHVTNFCVVTL